MKVPGALWSLTDGCGRLTARAVCVSMSVALSVHSNATVALATELRDAWSISPEDGDEELETGALES